MPVVNRIADFSTDTTTWPQHLHRIPELGLVCHPKAALVAEGQHAFGVDKCHEGSVRTEIGASFFARLVEHAQPRKGA